MEECELCGKQIKDIYVVVVEDVELRVCAKDAKGKKVVAMHNADEKQPIGKRVKVKKDEEQQLPENYGALIHKARENMKLPIKVLAEMLNEKETLLTRVENQETMPSIELTKKLERSLKIKLIESSGTQSERVSTSKKNEKVTLGDFIDTAGGK